jgi:hypothetical protein
MNSNDMERQKNELERQKLHEDELDDMGVLVLSDECDAIEQVMTFFKYCVPISIVIIAGIITFCVLNNQRDGA